MAVISAAPTRKSIRNRTKLTAIINSTRRGREGRHSLRVIFFMSVERCQKRAMPFSATQTEATSWQIVESWWKGAFATVCAMALELLTISEAENRTGLARSTIVRWLQADRLKKREQGKIAFSDLQRCVSEQRTGRPCMSGRSVPYSTRNDCRPLAEKNMQPYCGGQGLRRLAAMIKALTWERADRGQDLDQLRNVLIDALAATKTVEGQHSLFVKLYGTRKRGRAGYSTLHDTRS